VQQCPGVGQNARPRGALRKGNPVDAGAALNAQIAYRHLPHTLCCKSPLTRAHALPVRCIQGLITTPQVNDRYRHHQRARGEAARPAPSPEQAAPMGQKSSAEDRGLQSDDEEEEEEEEEEAGDKTDPSRHTQQAHAPAARTGPANPFAGGQNPKHSTSCSLQPIHPRTLNLQPSSPIFLATNPFQTPRHVLFPSACRVPLTHPIPHTPYHIPHTTYPIPHTPYPMP
jgi:hypothetical protein